MNRSQSATPIKERFPPKRSQPLSLLCLQIHIIIVPTIITTNLNPKPNLHLPLPLANGTNLPGSPIAKHRTSNWTVERVKADLLFCRILLLRHHRSNTRSNRIRAQFNISAALMAAGEPVGDVADTHLVLFFCCFLRGVRSCFFGCLQCSFSRCSLVLSVMGC